MFHSKDSTDLPPMECRREHSAVEACKVRRLGIPDRFIEHGERSELLADLGLDASGIAQACRDGAAQSDFAKGAPSRRVS